MIFECDVCKYCKENSSKLDVKCCLCKGLKGILKRISNNNSFAHIICELLSDSVICTNYEKMQLE